MKYLLFIRTSLEINEKTQFLLEIRNIKKNEKNKFQEFIIEEVKRSKSLKLYINIYIIHDYYLQKIAWIKEGELYTL